jgi:hypothetical protein
MFCPYFASKSKVAANDPGGIGPAYIFIFSCRFSNCQGNFNAMDIIKDPCFFIIPVKIFKFQSVHMVDQRFVGSGTAIFLSYQLMVVI